MTSLKRKYELIDNTKRIAKISKRFYLFSQKDIEDTYGLEKRYNQSVPYSYIPDSILESIHHTNLYLGYFWRFDKKEVKRIVKTVKNIDITSVVRAHRLWSKVIKAN